MVLSPYPVGRHEVNNISLSRLLDQLHKSIEKCKNFQIKQWYWRIRSTELYQRCQDWSSIPSTFEIDLNRPEMVTHYWVVLGSNPNISKIFTLAFSVVFSDFLEEETNVESLFDFLLLMICHFPWSNSTGKKKSLIEINAFIFNKIKRNLIKKSS